jgi:hypothetical protein
MREATAIAEVGALSGSGTGAVHARLRNAPRAKPDAPSLVHQDRAAPLRAGRGR